VIKSGHFGPIRTNLAKESRNSPGIVLAMFPDTFPPTNSNRRRRADQPAIVEAVHFDAALPDRDRQPIAGNDLLQAE